MKNELLIAFDRFKQIDHDCVEAAFIRRYIMQAGLRKSQIGMELFPNDRKEFIAWIEQRLEQQND